MTKQEFINSFFSYAAEAEQVYKVPAVVSLAVSALETGWGSAAPGNAYHGIKATSGWSGKVVNFKTREVFDNKSVSINADFRAYDTPREAFMDFARMISSSKIADYQNAMKSATVEDFITNLSGSYATDPQWAAKVKSIATDINNNYLKKKELTAGGGGSFLWWLIGGAVLTAAIYYNK